MDSFWFWAVAGAMTVLTAAWLIRGLIRGDESPPAAAARDMQVYRDQLAEADRDLARGTLTEAESRQVKTEIARRLLEADRALKAETRPVAVTLPWPAVALIAAAMLAALVIYQRIGLPGYPDLPVRERLAMADETMANRPRQTDAEAAAPPPAPVEVDPEFAALMEKLRAAVDPATATDLRGLGLLARNEAAVGNYVAARVAQERLVAVMGDQATAEDFATLAELMVLAAGGYVSPEAEAVLIRTLELDPKNGMARYFSGLMFAQGGRYDRAFALWRPLLEDSPPDARWLAPLNAQIGEAAARAGIPFQPPEAMAAPGASPGPAPGPGAEDMAAAADMTPEERQQMIEGMVGQLQDRLATQGGTSAEWARLITALGVLGRTDQAQAIYDEARTRFAGQDADLAILGEAAASAGLAP